MIGLLPQARASKPARSSRSLYRTGYLTALAGTTLRNVVFYVEALAPKLCGENAITT